jgi:SAM-dependent methyltransferase
MIFFGKIRRTYLYLEAIFFDKKAMELDLPRPKHFDHLGGIDWLVNRFDKDGMTILEIGAKEVTGKSIIKSKILKAKYIGIDISKGKNVDIVCDAHELSKFIKENSIDCVYSASVFEHLYAPWIVAEEISKVLKKGGYVCIETVFNFKTHERPWNFFHFSDLGLKVLFNKEFGFECIDSGLDLPIRGRFSLFSPKYLRMKEVYGLMSHSYYVGEKKSNFKSEEGCSHFNWLRANPSILNQNNVYPSKQDNRQEKDTM